MQASGESHVLGGGLAWIGMFGHGEGFVQREDQREIRRGQPAMLGWLYPGLPVPAVVRDERTQRLSRPRSYALVDRAVVDWVLVDWVLVDWVLVDWALVDWALVDLVGHGSIVDAASDNVRAARRNASRSPGWSKASTRSSLAWISAWTERLVRCPAGVIASSQARRSAGSGSRLMNPSRCRSSRVAMIRVLSAPID